MTRICMYHADDFDGIASAAVVHFVHPDVKFIPADYRTKSAPFIQPEDTLYIVDFSLPVEEMKRLRESGVRLIWIDHHEVVIKKAWDAMFYCDGIQRWDVSACELTWKFFFPDTSVPHALQLIGSRDMGDFNDVTESFDRGLYIALNNNLDPAHSLWKLFFSANGHDPRVLNVSRAGHSMLTCEKLLFARTAEKIVERVIFEGITGLAANFINSAGSAFFDSIIDREKDKLVILYSKIKNGEFKFSMFSSHEDVHVGELAARHGGGGRKGAAGFNAPDISCLTFVED